MREGDRAWGPRPSVGLPTRGPRSCDECAWLCEPEHQWSPMSPETTFKKSEKHLRRLRRTTLFVLLLVLVLSNAVLVFVLEET